MKIFLNKNEERRLKSGHQWIFSNEINKIEGEIVNGDVCELYSIVGDFLGKGFYNKNSLISYRHLTGKIDEEINKEFFKNRMLRADERRKILSRNVYRIVNSESDFLPGLIIDRFENAYSIQIFSLGMSKFIDVIKEILIENFNAEYIVEKADNELRLLEGLDTNSRIIYTKYVLENQNLIIDNYGIKYILNLLKGQKTGAYLDQIENRLLLRKYIKKSDKVLDLFCNEGGFALNASLCDTSEITAVDSSEYAINNAKINASINNIKNINFICSDVFKFLNSSENEKYDIIILDPPSFTKSKKNIQSAIKGYIELNSKAMQMLNPGSILFTFSCSHHINEEAFEQIIIKSSVKAGRKVQILYFSNCSIDHPVLPAMNETKYLKSYLLRII
jgi:23S rRNA (cytosine1962-C5)-methyltransferase